MNVLLLGSGGREHAIAWKLRESPKLERLFCMPGNPGLALVSELVPGDVLKFDGIVKFCRQNRVDLVVVGPEDPLAAGVVDHLTREKIRAFGPTRMGARLEADKWFAKEIMRQQAVPTAEARIFTDADAADEFVKTRDEPLVIKAVGLAKGKGVTICHRPTDALETIDRVMRKKSFGTAGERIVIEEMLQGPECSILAFVDRRNLYVMESAQDHKPLEDGDTGPMTGGMGSYSPTPLVTDAMLSQIERDILIPMMDGMMREGIEYRGVLYAGLMLTPNGPKVLEFNCRFGDPETQPLMMRLQSDLLSVFNAVVDGKLDQCELKWDARAAVGVVAASKGYPGQYETGLRIEGVDRADAMKDVKVFHSGTGLKDGKLVTAGGRVLTVTALGDTVASARDRAYEAMSHVRFPGMQYRRDIAARALRGV